MRPLHAFVSLLAAPLVPVCFVACGSSSSGGAATDGGGTTDAPPFREAGGSSSSGSGDSGVLTPPSGTHLVTTTNLLQADAVTADGYAIYTDTTDDSVWAVDIKGGVPQKIASSVGANAVVTAIQSVVLVWANVNATTGIGQLTVWTSANAAKGGQMLSTASTLGGAVSKDQSHLIFMDSSTMTTTAIAVAGVDGTGKKTVVPMASVSTACTPAVGFVGNDGLAAYCPMAPAADAGTNAATLTRFASPSWMETSISTSAFTGFAGTPTGDHVIFFDNAGLEAYSVATGMSTLIDKSGDSFVISPDGSKVVYGTVNPGVDGGAASAGPFKVSPIAMPSGTLLGSGIDAFYGISPDGNWVLGFTQQTMTNLTNTILGSTTTPGMPKTLVKTPTSSAIGDDFTQDSKFAIYTDTITTTMTVSGSVTSGNLNAVALTAGAMPMQLGTAVWQEAAGPGSKVIFNPLWTPPANLGFGVADLMEIDLSSATPAAKTLVTQADANFFLTSDRSQIVYSFSTGSGGAPTAASGLYVMPVP